MTSLIDIRDLTFSFQRKRVLDAVSLSINDGDHVAILGPNGSGKSTLLRCINRILTPPPRTVFIEGVPLEAIKQKSLATKLAYVPQTHFKQVAFTVREYLALARYPHGDGWRKESDADREAIASALAETDLEHLAKRPMNRLSGGECQKVLIAAALTQQAPILLLDEATAFLDFKHKTQIHRLLQVLSGKGKTIISVTHDINHAALSSNRIFALKAGEVVFDGTPEAFMTPDVMHQVYSEHFLFTPHPATGKPVVVPKAVS